jgi:hypothetical protein
MKCSGGSPVKEVIDWCSAAGTWVLKVEQAELIGSYLSKGDTWRLAQYSAWCSAIMQMWSPQSALLPVTYGFIIRCST